MSVTTGPETAETSRDPLLDTAFEYFARVSIDWNDSFPAQGAALAKACKISGQDPEVLSDTLRDNPGSLDKMANAANRHHVKASVQISPKTADDIKAAVKDSFDWAKRMMVLDASELDEFLTGYEQSKKSNFAGIRYQNRADNMIRKKEAALQKERRRELAASNKMQAPRT